MIYEIAIIVALALILILFLRKMPKVGAMPQRNLTQFEQAEIFFKKGNWKRAEEYFCQAAAKDPKNVKIYQRLGQIYINLANYKDAKEAFQTALDIERSNCFDYYYLAKAYLGLKERANAKMSLQKALDLQPNNRHFRKLMNKLRRS